MNYRHAFHAGGAADVFKHAVLARALAHLTAKPKRLRFVDVFAGIGFYDLAGEEATRTLEWRGGIGRLFDMETGASLPLPGAAEALLSPWREAVAACHAVATTGAPRRYPGSPGIAQALLRPDDRLVLNELHPQDHAILAEAFARERRAKVLKLDAWTALRSLLPPPERRGLVLIDPPFEAADEIERLCAGLAAAHRRFATGTYLVWYPVKAQAATDALARRIRALGLPKTLRAELLIRRADSDARLNGSGLVLVNPPWGLEAELAVLLPALAARLADEAAGSGGARLEWLVGET